jgi:hypothetical protein
MQRLYNFVPGTRISSQQVDDELDQIVAEVNNNGANITTANNNIASNLSKINSLDTNPYFRLNVTSGQTYSTTGADQLITFGAAQLPLSVGFTAGTNIINCNTDGIYKIHGILQLSGLNSNVLATLKFNVTINGITTAYFRTVRGATGWDGGNGGGVWIEVDELLALPAGATIQIYANIGEAPRTIMGVILTAFKISKNTVAVS